MFLCLNNVLSAKIHSEIKNIRVSRQSIFGPQREGFISESTEMTAEAHEFAIRTSFYISLYYPRLIIVMKSSKR